MNLLLVDSTVKDYEVFVSSVNATTRPVVYFPHTTREELLAALHGPIERIAVVSHTTTFIERESLFSDSNVELFRTMIETHQVKHIDYLACNTLGNPEWTEYFKKIPCVIGASNDLTGNLKYGGDWVMESTSEDIEAIYFTQSIEYYKYFLSDFTDTNGIQYTITDSTVSVSGFIGTDVFLTIPSSVTNIDVTYSVTSIGGFAFYGKSLTSVTIPASVTSIGYYAFESVTTLVSLTIENGTTLTIGDGAFFNTRLTEVTIPASVTSIGVNAFNLISTLKTLTIINGTNQLTIGANAFSYSSLTNVTIPASVTSIGKFAFVYIRKLVGLTIVNGTTLTIDEMAFAGTGLTDVTIPASVTSIGSGAFNTLSSVSITSSTVTQSDTFPSGINITLYTLTGTTLTLTGTTLISVTPNDLSIYDLSTLQITSIGTVFNNWTTTSTVYIPSNTTYSGILSDTVTLYKKVIVGGVTYTLLYDNTLYSVSPPNLTSYDLSALPIISIGTVFKSGNWTTTSNVYIPSNTTYSGILSDTVTLCKESSGALTDVYPKTRSSYNLSDFSITSIGTIFQGLPLSSITLPLTLTSIVNKAFRDCENLTEVTFTSTNNLTIGDYAFQNCKLLDTVTFPSNLTSVGESAFQNCAVEGTITFPSSLTTIGDYAFQNNKLTTVNIPSFDILGNHSFSYNTITRVTIG